MLTKDQAICIRVVDYSETSQVVTFFTRQNGKVGVIAKGAKRTPWPFGGPLEIFSCGTIAFSDSSRDKLATLVEFEPLAGIVDFSALTGNIFVLHCCLFACELANALTKDYDPHPGLFDSLLAFLGDITRCKTAGAGHGGGLVPLIMFQLSVLREIGLCPVLDHCVNCKNPFSDQWPEVYFSNNVKGLICRDCQGPFPDKIALAGKAVKCLLNAESLALAQDPTLVQIEGFLINYITDVLGRPVKMAKYILVR
jgi:DNA repair protein RecO (recombination protein O)